MQLIYGPKIKIYNTKTKLSATDFIPAELSLEKDSDSKVTAKRYCPDPARFLTTIVLLSVDPDRIYVLCLSCLLTYN